MISRFGYVPLVWGCLRAYLELEPDLLDAYELEQPVFLPEQVPGAVDSMEDPSVFMVSCYIWNFRRQMTLCKEAKERFPGITVVAGGPHVPDDSRTFFDEHPYVDFLIHKEGEKPFAALLRALLEEQPDFSALPSLSWRDASGAVRRNPLGDQLPREIEVPSPWLTGLLDPAMELARSHGYPVVTPWETNRGCPYSCTFCDWGSNTMSKVRQYSEERLHAEIDYLADRQVHAVLCADANFGILPRDKALAEHFAARREADGYPRKFAASYAKNATVRVFEIGQIMATAGMSDRAILAMQSGSAEALEHVKRSNMKAERYEDLAHRFREVGVDANTEVILGLPHETRESFVRGICRMLEIGIHGHISVYECVMLPNSEMSTPAYRERYALETIRRAYLQDDIEQFEVVVAHSTMTREDWVYMYLFGATVQALHNRGLTGYIGRYLQREGILPYERFYRHLLDRALDTGEGVFAEPILRAKKLLEEYLVDSSIPNEGKVLSQSDMAEKVRRLIPDKESWLIYEWCWAHVQADLDRFYTELRLDLIGEGVDLDARLEDLFQYQRATVFAIGDRGARFVLFNHDWPGYFRDDKQEAGLVSVPTPMRFEPPRERLR
ncbi:B12-binding domain-containing radical SAM protein [Streptomyces sp. NPDC003522]